MKLIRFLWPVPMTTCMLICANQGRGHNSKGQETTTIAIVTVIDNMLRITKHVCMNRHMFKGLHLTTSTL